MVVNFGLTLIFYFFHHYRNSLNFLLLFFWLDPKEPKSQDAAKLPPHKAGLWPAAASAPAPLLVMFGYKKIRGKELNTESQYWGFNTLNFRQN
jgi:hypothetical protein